MRDLDSPRLPDDARAPAAATKALGIVPVAIDLFVEVVRHAPLAFAHWAPVRNLWRMLIRRPARPLRVPPAPVIAHDSTAALRDRPTFLRASSSGHTTATYPLLSPNPRVGPPGGRSRRGRT